MDHDKTPDTDFDPAAEQIITPADDTAAELTLIPEPLPSVEPTLPEPASDIDDSQPTSLVDAAVELDTADCADETPAITEPETRTLMADAEAPPIAEPTPTNDNDTSMPETVVTEPEPAAETDEAVVNEIEPAPAADDASSADSIEAPDEIADAPAEAPIATETAVDDETAAQQPQPPAEAAIKTVGQDEILQAALQLFAEKGYFNTSLADIKDAVGLKTTSGIYQYFKTKQAIAQTLQENILDSLSISIDDIRRRNRKAAEQLREIVDLLFKLTDEAPAIIQFLLFTRSQDFLPDQPPLMQTAPFSKLTRIIQNGIKEGDIRSLDPVLAYSYFFGIITHTLGLILNGTLPKTADSYEAQAWLAAWGSIAKK